MRILIGSVVLIASASVAWGQQATTAVTPEVTARVIAEVAASARPTVKNSPLTCDEVNESVQMLADGNRISRTSTTKMYRNSEGRVRREFGRGQGGMLGSVYSTGGAVSIAAPSAGFRYHLDTEAKTATVVEMQPGQGVSIVGVHPLSEADKAKYARAKEELERSRVVLDHSREKLAELKAAMPLMAIPSIPAIPPIPPVPMAPIGENGVYYMGGQNAKYETRTEELGTRDFEGVSAEGTRRTTTIPAGAIGNERPIEIVYERWFSKELGLTVFSKNTDPRFGEQTYKITNLVRSEPDPSLFSVPTGYKTIGDNGGIYRVSATKAEAQKSLPARRAAVEKTKP